MNSWHNNIINSDEAVSKLLKETRRIAVLGIKIEKDFDKPAFYVPEYLLRAGFDVIPVPVFYPDVTQILGRKVYRKLMDIPGEIDMVNVFRRPIDLAAHMEDIIGKAPKAVWFQLGIRNDAVAEDLARRGIKVVQDMCLMVQHRRLAV